MRLKIKRVALATILTIVMIGMYAFPLPGVLSQLGPENVYASVSDLTIIQGSADAAQQGRSNVHFDFFVTNNGTSDFDFRNAQMLFTNPQGLTIRQMQPISGNIGQGETIVIAFQIDISERASEGSRAFQIAFNDEEDLFPEFFHMTIMEPGLPPPDDLPTEPRVFRHAAEFSHTLGGMTAFSHGIQNTITFQVLNRGDTAIRDAEFTLELPDGMFISGSTTSFIGSISIGQRVGRSFSVTLHEDLEGGRSHPIVIRLTGTDRGGREVSIQNTFYIPVTENNVVEGSVRDVVIENISIPAEVSADENFTMSFNVRNTGDATISDMLVSAVMPEGILNMSSATFVVNSLGVGATRSFSVIMSAQDGANRSFPIRIAVEPLDGGTGNVIQYTSVFVGEDEEEDSDSVMTPQLMINRHSYGGTSVMAGSVFQLDMNFINTSDRRLSNIRVSLSSEAGTFVPVDGSNSFFVDSVEAGGQFGRAVTLRASPSAEQRTTAITVRMTYEDGNAQFTAEDIITIPVMQVMRLVVDEIVPPFEVFAFTPGFSSLQFYNMGHTTLNNLMITAEGDFDVMQSNSYYVGNMEGGTSDTFTFSFIPRAVGPMEGMVIFTYEDIDGEQLIYEVPFVFMAMEMPVWDDGWMFEGQEEEDLPWALIIFGIVAVALLVTILVWRNVRRARLNKRLEIQDEAFNTAFDLEKQEQRINE